MKASAAARPCFEPQALQVNFVSCMSGQHPTAPLGRRSYDSHFWWPQAFRRKHRAILSTKSSWRI
jgi:hypothetical protein